MSRFLFFSVFLVVIISGCSSSSVVFDQKAKVLGFHFSQISGKNFTHTIYENKKLSKGLLHVYLGGDGTPWFQGQYITDDPTPTSFVMLNLMKLDKQAAIYLGRPCYHLKAMPRNCKKSLWTNKRYSRVVVNSMVDVLNRYIQKHDIEELKLFGFSGGGTLAMLLAPRLRNVTTIVTLAGNLDIDAWTKYHGYLPLTGSLNPSKAVALLPNIQQLHFAASLDKNVPYSMIKHAVKKQKNAKMVLINSANHSCCWKKIWPKILEKID